MATKAMTAYVTGLKDATNLSPADINAWDWSWGLSNQARFSGATPLHWSVLSHTGLVYTLAMKDMGGQVNLIDQIALLLHDASEAYMVDLPSPIKQIPESKFFRDMEDDITRRLFSRFGIEMNLVNWDLVHRYDLQALAVEFARFFPHVRDSGFIPKPVYDMALGSVPLVVGKPWEYIAHLKHLAINLADVPGLPGCPDIQALFEMPPHLIPYVDGLTEETQTVHTTDEPIDLTIFDRTL